MRKLTLFLLLFSFEAITADSKMRRFQTKIQAECQEQEVSLLLVKKSLIELLKGEECEAKFTSILIKMCKNIDCQKINQIYREVEQIRSGSVVGD